jgi:hypothetical protein
MFLKKYYFVEFIEVKLSIFRLLFHLGATNRNFCLQIAKKKKEPRRSKRRQAK